MHLYPKRRAEMEAELMVREETSITEAKKPGLEELRLAFLAALDVAGSSKATYDRQIKKYLCWLQDTGKAEIMAELKREDILEYKNWLQEQDLSVYSVNGYLSAVRKLYIWLEAEKIYPNIAKVKSLKKPKGHRKDSLSGAQLRDILSRLDTSTLEGLRDYAIINLMARTGLRDIEVSRALVSDIKQESGQPVLWIQGKGRDSKDEFVLLTDEAEKPIRDWMLYRGVVAEDAPLFSSLSDRNKGQALSSRSISRIVKKAFLAAGLDKATLTAHSLRHTAITLAIIGGASLHQAQAMARHSDPSTTMTYFHNIARVSDGAEHRINF